jgi:hypothetical protein
MSYGKIGGILNSGSHEFNIISYNKRKYMGAFLGVNYRTAFST